MKNQGNDPGRNSANRRDGIILRRGGTGCAAIIAGGQKSRALLRYGHESRLLLFRASGFVFGFNRVADSTSVCLENCIVKVQLRVIGGLVAVAERIFLKVAMMRVLLNRRRCAPRYVLALFFVCRLAIATPSAGESEPKSAPSLKLPTVRLAPIENFDDLSAYVQEMGRRAAERATGASKESDPTKKAAELLAAANVVLGEQLEPLLSSFVLGLDSTRVMETKVVIGALDQAEIWLNESEKTLTAMPPEVPPDQPANVGEAKAAGPAQLKNHIGVLRAFAQGYRALFLPAPDNDRSRALRRAESAMSIALEDSDPRISSAARLWQLCLRSADAPKPGESIDLSTQLAGPAPYPYFERLLRYRIAAASGSFAMATAALISLEDRARDSFSSAGNDRADAVRAAQFARLQVLAAWHDQLDPATSPDEREWCWDQFLRISGEQFKEDRATVARVRPAVPNIFVPAKPGDELPKPNNPAEPE